MISIKIFKYFLIETGSYSNESEAKMPKLIKYFLQDENYFGFNEFSMLCEALKVELNGINIAKLHAIMERYDENVDLDIEMQHPRRYNRAWTVTGVSSSTDMKKVRSFKLPNRQPKIDSRQGKPTLQQPPPSMKATNVNNIRKKPIKKEMKKEPIETNNVSNPLFMKKKRSKPSGRATTEIKAEGKKKRLSANGRLSANVLKAMNLSESEIAKMASI